MVSNKTLAIIGILLSAIMLIGTAKFNWGLFQLFGWTTLTLTKASFTSSDPFFNDEVWILTVAQGGLGQHAIGTIDNEEIGELSGKKPANDLKITIDYSKFSWEYPIIVDYASMPIYRYTFKKWTNWNPFYGGEQLLNDVKANCPNYRWYGKFPMSFDYFCINEEQITSYVGYFDNCNFHAISTITVEAKGQRYSETIDTKGKVSTKVGPYVYVVWNGNLLKQNCYSQQPYKPFYANGWKIGSAQYYEDYKNKYDFFVSMMGISKANNNPPSEATIISMINEVNRKADRFVYSTQSFYGGQIKNPYDVSKAYLEVGVGSDVQVPVYTFYVKADWLGLYQPTAIPQILDAKGTMFKSGEWGNLYVKFKNVGDRGNFEVYAICESPINVLDTTKTVGLDSGEIATAYIRVGANVNQRYDKYCTIYVKSLGNVDSRRVLVTVDPQKVCNPGMTICENNVVKQCNEFGSGYNIIETCGANEYCTYVNGQAQCVKKGEETEECAWWDVFCHVNKATISLSKSIESFLKSIFEPVTDFFNTIGLLMGGIAAIIGFAIGRDMFVKKKKDWVGLLIALLLAVFLFFLVKLTWWIGIITLIGYIIYKAIK